jgi:hypothetical protein
LKRLHLIIFIATIGLSSCYKFDPISPKGTVSPTFAFPIISADQKIDTVLLALIGHEEINLEEAVPTWAKDKNVYFIDTVDYALVDIYEKAKEVRYVAFRLNVSNDFPSTAKAQIIFLNEQESKIDSLFYPSAFQVYSSTANSLTGTVISRGKSNIDIVIDQQRLETLRDATKIVVKCSASNEGVPVNMFEFYLNYYLTVKLSVRIGVDINIEKQ